MWHSGDYKHKPSIRRSNLNVKRHKLDQICHDWFIKARIENIPISGRQIQAKAKEIAANIGITGFLASNGWLQKWCNRRNITLKNISGETAANNQGNVEPLDLNICSSYLFLHIIFSSCRFLKLRRIYYSNRFN